MVDAAPTRSRRWVLVWVGVCTVAAALVAILTGDRTGGFWVYVAVAVAAALAFLPLSLVMVRSGSALKRVLGGLLLGSSVATTLLVVAILIGSQSYFRAWAAYENGDSTERVYTYAIDHLTAAHDNGMGDLKSDRWPVLTSRGILLDRRAEMLYVWARSAEDAGLAGAMDRYRVSYQIARTQGDTDLMELLEQGPLADD